MGDNYESDDVFERAVNSILLDNYNIQLGIIDSIANKDVSPPLLNIQPVWKSFYEGDDEPRQATIAQDIPLLMLGNKKFSFEMEVEEGDFVILFVCDRSIDNFLKDKGIVDPADTRFNNLSDSFALPLCLELAGNMDNKKFGLRSNDGKQFISLTEEGIEIEATEIKIKSQKTTITGELEVSGKITSKTKCIAPDHVTSPVGVSLGKHTHNDATGAPTTPPIPSGG